VKCDVIILSVTPEASNFFFSFTWYLYRTSPVHLSRIVKDAAGPVNHDLNQDWRW